MNIFFTGKYNRIMPCSWHELHSAERDGMQLAGKAEIPTILNFKIGVSFQVQRFRTAQQLPQRFPHLIR